MTLNMAEMGQAIVEYLERRGVDTRLEDITFWYDGAGVYHTDVKNVVLDPAGTSEGPYR